VTALTLNADSGVTVDLIRKGERVGVSIDIDGHHQVDLTVDGARLLATHLLRLADAIDDGWAPATAERSSPATDAATPESQA
jgi:hypothetical protein